MVGAGLGHVMAGVLTSGNCQLRAYALRSDLRSPQ